MEALPVSVIICVKNMESNIEECLIAVEKNNPAEIVVVDGNSTDRTVEVARRYTEKIYSDNGGGLQGARQVGVEKATQEYIVYLDADTVIPERTLSTMLTELKAGGYANIQAKVLAKKIDTYWERAEGWYMGYLRARNNQGGLNAGILRRDLVLNIKFDLKFAGEEYDFLKKLKLGGYKLGVSSASVYCYHRADMKSVCKQWFKYGRDQAQLMKRWGPLRKGLWTPLAMVYFVGLSLIKGKPQYIPFVVLVMGFAGTAGMAKGFVELIGEAFGRKNKSDR
jgi:glycosyltransferase involved in cell wall biosynthesis